MLEVASTRVCHCDRGLEGSRPPRGHLDRMNGQDRSRSLELRMPSARRQSVTSYSTTAEPPQWEGRDKFAGFSGVAEEKGFASEEESENLAKRLREIMLRQGKIRPEGERAEGSGG
eukprot:4001508-Amphidinium_carterae.1